MATHAPARDLPPPSALTSLISTPPTSSKDYAYPSHLHSLALTILHNLRHQHDWHSLIIHTTSPLSPSTSSAIQLTRPLISGIPPRRVYTHPNMQIELIKAGLREEDVPPERVFVAPSALGEKWTLKMFAGVFEGVPTPGSRRQEEWEMSQGEERQGKEGGGRQWAGDDVKRMLLATVDDDSTVVYYVVHDGIVKPRQN